MREYYTYAYLREDGTPYYIGRGKGRRLKQRHKHGVPSEDRILLLKTELTFEESVRHEVYMIAILGRKDVGTGILRNHTDGGEGTLGRVFSEESIQKMVDSHTGKKLSEEHKETLRKALRGKPHNHGAAISKAKLLHHPLRGQNLPKEWAENVGKAMAGRRWWHRIIDGKLETIFKHEPPDDSWKPKRKPS